MRSLDCEACAMRAAEVDRLRARVAHLLARIHEVEMALIQAPRVPRWPRTPYSRWYYRQRAQAIRGAPDRLAEAMDRTGREVTWQELDGCCDRHPAAPLTERVLPPPPGTD
jgi:anti-sigma factor RsiW